MADIDVLSLLPRSPVNTAVEQIMQYWRELKDPSGLEKVNGLVARGLSLSSDKPRKEDIPAIYVMYRYLDGDRNTTALFLGERLVSLACFFQIFDFKEDGIDYGIQDKLEDYVRYNIDALGPGEDDNQFVPTKGHWRFDSRQNVIPIRFTDAMDGVTNQPVRPPFYMARADINILVNNKYGTRYRPA
jgi:hypothetical protein